MRWLILSCLLIIAACGSDPKPQQKPVLQKIDSGSIPKDSVAAKFFTPSIDSLPPALHQCISNKLKLDTLDENRWENNWRKMYHSDSVRVNRLFADFDGNGLPDYAMILRDAKEQIFVYVMLARDGGKTYQSLVLDTLGSTLSGMMDQGLDILPRGKYPDEFGEIPGRKITLACPGITVNYFEKAAVTYYWKGKAFSKFFSAD